jgi:hypothetical protein
MMEAVWRVLLLFLVTTTAATAHAEPAATGDHAAEIDHLLKSGRHMRAAGQVLVGVGCVDAIAATIIGALGVEASPDDLGDVTPGAIRGSEVPTLQAAAIGLAVAAAALIAVGVPLMAEADGRLGRARALVGRSSVQLAASPRGVALVW